ncbi:hypothetical protein [Nocardia noduli]|uniref:hypothetical protein n=1 Tax=Nocardia noduli TaxID=2815722 RepID=UPI0034D6EF98
MRDTAARADLAAGDLRPLYPASRCGVSQPTATAWLQDLVTAGLLQDLKIGRDRLFINREFLKLLVVRYTDRGRSTCLSSRGAGRPLRDIRLRRHRRSAGGLRHATVPSFGSSRAPVDTARRVDAVMVRPPRTVADLASG